MSVVDAHDARTQRLEMQNVALVVNGQEEAMDPVHFKPDGIAFAEEKLGQGCGPVGVVVEVEVDDAETLGDDVTICVTVLVDPPQPPSTTISEITSTNPTLVILAPSSRNGSETLTEFAPAVTCVPCVGDRARIDVIAVAHNLDTRRCRRGCRRQLSLRERPSPWRRPTVRRTEESSTRC